jgi:hypothetical protein
LVLVVEGWAGERGEVAVDEKGGLMMMLKELI